MSQLSFYEEPPIDFKRYDLGGNYKVDVFKDEALFYRNGVLLKSLTFIQKKFLDKTASRIFLTSIILEGAKKAWIAKHLGFSRQTLDDWLKKYDRFGDEGLVHSYSTRKNRAQNRKEKLADKVEKVLKTSKESKEIENSDEQISFFDLTTENENKPVQEIEASDEHNPVIENKGDIEEQNEVSIEDCKAIPVVENEENIEKQNEVSIEDCKAIPVVENEENIEEQNEVSIEDCNTIPVVENEENIEEQMEVLDKQISEFTPEIDTIEGLFEEKHGWEKSRYAGTAVFMPVLFSLWGWLKLVTGTYGNKFKIFLVFLFMSARNIRSIEQLKNIRETEAALVLGLPAFPHEKKAREWFYDASEQNKSSILLEKFKVHQVKSGLVNSWLILTDGHLLPYTGKDKVRYAFSTQRKQPVPGRTNMVSCDVDGNVFDFEIQEGTGDLRQRIIDIDRKWRELLPQRPTHVFDREGTGHEFFYKLVNEKIQFVTWEKNINKKHINSLDESLFTKSFKKNGKEYSVFEEPKKVEFKLENKEGEKETYQYELRRICLWNHSSNRKTCGLASVSSKVMNTVDCAEAILSRWGASENTFKHLKDRHPLHYHPGFKKVESDDQQIANPELKEKNKTFSSLKKEVIKLRVELSKTKKHQNKDGSDRKNCRHTNINNLIEQKELEILKLKENIKELPERVDLNFKGLEDYKSFKTIDNEGKYLFDFVTSSVWNARKWMVNFLLPYYKKNEAVDLFYAISECHGWVKVTDKVIIFRLEPLPQPKRRSVQDFLCKKLTSLGARVPNGKRMIFEVGNSPLKK